MRGKPFRLPGVPLSLRNIPAHAGKTAEELFQLFRVTEHPRACGENQATGLPRLF